MVTWGMARVLHIEDDAMSRLLVRKLLTSVGHGVIEAASGLEGIRLAESQPPDLVLVDINIPDLDGYEVTLRLRGMPELAGVPIVAITAEGDRETSLAVGADGFISKPIDAGGFPQQIEKFLAGYRERADSEPDARLRLRSQKIVQRLERKVQQLSEANRELEEMARLRREFLQNLSHEFATPMTPVVGYLRLLLDEEVGPLTPLQRKCLGSIQTSTQQLRRLIDTLLDVSTIEMGRMHIYERDYDLAHTLQRAIDEVRPRFDEASIHLHVSLASPKLEARGDTDKVRRALVHVLDNAAKFTPRGGEVAVAVTPWTAPDGSAGYVVSVADSGPGVSPGDRARILEPFFQVDGSTTRAHGGVGLGLAFARLVVEALGGKIEVQSPPEEPVGGHLLTGTAVRLMLRKQPPSTPRGR
jgi:signal transduction histidine kinase